MHAAKAIVAGITCGITAAIPLVDNGLSAKDALLIAAAVLVGAFPTWAVPNTASNDEAGAVNVPLLVYVLAGVALVLVILELVGHPASVR